MAGYGLGAGFGAIIPFYSCSNIPLFLGFTSAEISLGITLALLFSSPTRPPALAHLPEQN
ncbi:permease [Halomonas sediminis]